ncbi:helix-turn-helix transcriptional regulator [Paeniglutamicibacter sp. NPDC012692]|uniref:helix-turn-helix transcriptional regulator n=1 Tax=Paeniglutamicibacter sp. NPDC012692 TaxID=3364388 RepID=UPI0036750A80
MTTPTDQARMIVPDQLVGAATVCDLLGIDRSTMSRRIAAGKLTPLARLDGPHGAFVFDLNDVKTEGSK